MTSTSSSTATVPVRGAGPLTTVFTTPDFCNTLYWSNSATPALSSSICMPPSFRRLWDYGAGFYSPGICPLGYTEGCSFPTSLAVSSLGSPFYGGPLATGETARICCPSGHTCLTGTAFQYSKCLSTDSLTTFLDTFWSTAAETTTLALVYAIQVRWKEADLSLLETDPTVYGGTITATATSTAANTADSTSVVSTSQSAIASATGSTVTDDSSESMSSSLKLGLGVGVPIFCVAFAALLFLFWRFLYKRKRVGETPGPEKSDSKVDNKEEQDDGPAELLSPMTPQVTASTTNEMDATAVMELETMEKVQELPAPVFVAELPGSMPSDHERKLHSP